MITADLNNLSFLLKKIEIERVQVQGQMLNLILHVLSRNTDVINCLYQIPNAIFKLICFPWAGGGSIHFAKWGQMNPELLEGKLMVT